MINRLFSFIVLVTAMLVFSGISTAEEITIVGTGSGMEILKAIGDEFSNRNPDIYVIIPQSIGSGGGIKSVGNDLYVIGRIARNIKDKEKHYGLTQMPIVKMPVVFFANRNVGIRGLSSKQICDIFSGKIQDWEEVGGNTGKIKVIRREDGDSSLQVLLDLFPGFKDITITEKSKTTYSDQKTLETVENTPFSISFGTFGNASRYMVDTLEINGKAPHDNSYPYNGLLSLIYKERNNKGNILKFIRFAQSDSAYKVIKEAGGLPVK